MQPNIHLYWAVGPGKTAPRRPSNSGAERLLCLFRTPLLFAMALVDRCCDSKSANSFRALEGSSIWCLMSICYAVCTRLARTASLDGVNLGNCDAIKTSTVLLYSSLFTSPCKWMFHYEPHLFHHHQSKLDLVYLSNPTTTLAMLLLTFLQRTLNVPACSLRCSKLLLACSSWESLRNPSEPEWSGDEMVAVEERRAILVRLVAKLASTPIYPALRNAPKCQLSS